MKVIPPQPFTFEGGKRAVLLLHGYTGSSNDVRMLGRYLEGKGYTCHSPQYKGHGVSAEELILAGPDDWWKDVLDGYHFLKEKGHEEIAVVGLSLGGVFSLKLGYTLPVKGIIPMCAPTHIRSEELIYKGILAYAEKYKKREQKSDEEIKLEMEQFKKTPITALKALKDLLQEVHDNVAMINTSTFVVQARHDEMINTDNATFIHEEVQAEKKKIKWYENSTHVITSGQEKDQLHEDIYQFLETLKWDPTPQL